MLFYLIGIKGNAMASLARVLTDYNYEVMGVDFDEHFATEDKLNCKVESFRSMSLNKDYYYIIGNAFKDHSVTRYLINNKFNYDYYPHFIATFFSKRFVCVAGCHGKTTTTSLLAHINNEANYIIGNGEGRGNKDNKWFILEACEYQNTFLNYKSEIALILNIDFDHPDFYKDIDDVISSYILFARKAFIIVINGDDPNSKYITGNVIRYGMNKENDIVFNVHGKNVYLCDEEYEMPCYGLHYAYDFVGAYIVSKLMNTKSEIIYDRLKNFIFPKRRREIKRIGSNIIVCDYAHHPSEIKALYRSLKEEYSENKIIAIYEPHTYSRTLKFQADYNEALALFDEAYILDIFTSAREQYNSEIEKEIYRGFLFKRFKKELITKTREMNNMVICFIGAGRIDKIYLEYIKKDSL